MGSHIADKNKTFAMLSKFWLLWRLEGWGESVKKVKVCDENLFSYSADAKTDRNKKLVAVSFL